MSLFRLGGKRIANTPMPRTLDWLEPDNQMWSREIFDAAGLDLEAAPPIVMPGTNIGHLQRPLTALPAFRHTALIAPACHDTASAIAGIPARGDDWAFISSGTWSLVGSVLNAPWRNDRQFRSPTGCAGGTLCTGRRRDFFRGSQVVGTSFRAKNRVFGEPSSVCTQELARGAETSGKGLTMTNKVDGVIFRALDAFKVELPSWGFANTGTRFGKFLQPAAAVSIEDKFSDAAQVHALTGACPTLALHVQWDLPKGLSDVALVEQLAEKHGVQPGSINPNVFQDQEYKYGSLGNPDAAIRKRALDHILEGVRGNREHDGVQNVAWFADGSNYPGTQSIRKRIVWFEEALKEVHRRLNPKQRLKSSTNPLNRPSTTPMWLTGAWRCSSRVPLVRRRWCWSIPVITTRRKILSKLWLGSCITR